MTKVSEIQDLENIVCPFCKTIQKPHCLVNSWSYSKTSVYRYECKCGKNFNFYRSKLSSWTIPKDPNKRRY